MRTIILAAIASGLLAVSGCAKNSSNTPATDQASAGTPGSSLAQTAPQTDQQAIEQAIRQHLSENKSINMSVMDMSMGQVSINGDQAQANAEFRLKTGGPAMQMTYSLQRHAGGWIVLTAQPSGGQFAHPPMDKNHAPGPGAAGNPSVPDVSGFMKTLPPPKSKGNPKG